MKSVIKAFYNSILIEYEHESSYSDIFGVKGNAIYIPRIFRIKTFVIKYQKMIRLFFYPLLLAYLIAYFPLIALQTGKYVILKLLNPKKEKLGYSVYLNTSNIKYYENLSKQKELNNSVLSIGSRTEVSGGQSYSLINILSFIQIVQAFFYAVLTPLWMVFTGRGNFLLFSYPAYEWYLIFLIFQDREHEVWLSNHYDRWTGLVEELELSNAILVQHGKLFYLTTKEGKEFIHFPEFSKKFQNFKKVYVLDTLSIDYFQKFINLEKGSFELNPLELDEVSWPDKFQSKNKVLVVGGQRELKFHQILLKRMKEEFAANVDICYKYHPRQTNKIGLPYVWELSSKAVPKCNILITYVSTLDIEINQKYPECMVIEYSEIDIDTIDLIIKKASKLISARI